MEWTPLVIASAPNGASKTKKDHPALPITPRELAETASTCLDAGAAMIHLHVRRADGSHTLDPDAYKEATTAIRKAVGGKIVIQVTSESGGIYRPEEQIQAVREVRPEAVSLALRELIPGKEHEPGAAEYFLWLSANACVPQYIIYNEQEVDWYRDLLARGVIPDAPHWVLFVLGRYTSGRESQPADLLPFLKQSLQRPWSTCAFGPGEHACTVAAASLGGHVRVGFENNLRLKDGTTAADNAALIAQAREAADVLNRPLMDADGLRNLFVDCVKD